ncbi:MAG: DUF6134 family protein [Bacteroidota bacterium]
MKYDVFLNDKLIGGLDIKRNTKDGLTYYLMRSDVNFRFLFKMTLNYTFETTYQNEMLIAGTTQNVMNDNVKSSSKVTWNGNHYLLQVDNDRSVLKNKRINYSMVSLYFQEPRQIAQVFSERYARFLPIKPLSDHRYELVMPDGKKNYYSYVNGICQSVEVNHTFGKIIFKLIQ